MAKEVGYWTVSVQTDSCNVKNQAHRLSQLVPALHPVRQKVVSPVCTPLNNGETAGYLIQLSAQVVEVPLKEGNRVFCIHTSLSKAINRYNNYFAPSRARRPSYGIVLRGPTNIFSCLHFFGFRGCVRYLDITGAFPFLSFAFRLSCAYYFSECVCKPCLLAQQCHDLLGAQLVPRLQSFGDTFHQAAQHAF